MEWKTKCMASFTVHPVETCIARSPQRALQGVHGREDSTEDGTEHGTKMGTDYAHNCCLASKFHGFSGEDSNQAILSSAQYSWSSSTSKALSSDAATRLPANQVGLPTYRIFFALLSFSKLELQLLLKLLLICKILLRRGELILKLHQVRGGGRNRSLSFTTGTTQLRKNSDIEIWIRKVF